MNNQTMVNYQEMVYKNHKQKKTILILLSLTLLSSIGCFILLNKGNYLTAVNRSLQDENSKLQLMLSERENIIDTLTTKNGQLYFLINSNYMRKNEKIQPEIPEVAV